MVQTCSAKDMNKHLEKDKIHQFLMGLDSEMYVTIRSNVLSLELLLGLNKAYAFIALEE